MANKKTTLAGPTPIYIAGIGNSDAAHWQRIWHETIWPGVWVEHGSWDHPRRRTWTAEVARAIESTAAPVTLVAHSLGCLTAIDAAETVAAPAIVGAFLVSVPDPAAARFPVDARGFDEITFSPLPFPSLVVTSENDPFGALEYQSSVAERLGARFENIGRAGHINTSSALGDWKVGQQILSRLLGPLRA